MYHRIAEEEFDPWGLAVKPAHFREHLAWLSENRTVLRLQDFADLHRRSALPEDAIAVTLDDGYACNSEVAAPLLERFRIPATIFLPVDLIERRSAFWWDELEEIVLNHEGSSLTLDGQTIALGERNSADRQWDAGSRPRTTRQAAFLDLHIRLSRKKPADLRDVMEDLRRRSKRPGETSSTKSPMTPEQVRRTVSEFVEFGSHALTHPWLTSLDLAEQRHEIRDSVDQCRAMTGSEPAAFAYPYGTFDDQSERLVQEAGFQCACATRDLAVSSRSRTFALPRVHVGDGDAAGLQRVLARALAD